LFDQAKIETALAVPVFSGKFNSPAFVFCCYSRVRTGSVPFVLKFVQQALKLLWSGLDKVQPHSSVGEDLWRDVAPADLGEMAADVEMQQHFMIKKRPIGAISNEPYERNEVDDELAVQIQALAGPSETPTAASIYTGRGTSSDYGTNEEHDHEEIFPSPLQPIQFQTYETVQNYINDAIKSVAEMQPVHHHVSTNASGSKRAHIFQQESSQFPYAQSQQQIYSQTLETQQSFIQHQQPTNIALAQYVQGQPGYEQSSPTTQSQPFRTQHPQNFHGEQPPQQQFVEAAGFTSYNNSSSGFLPAVASPLPLGRPLPLPNQVVNYTSNSSSHKKRGSSDSVHDFLMDPSLLNPTPPFEPTLAPDQVTDNFQLGATMQTFSPIQTLQNIQQSYVSNAHAGVGHRSAPTVHVQPSPSPVYSLPVDQLGANVISYPRLPLQTQENATGNAEGGAFCMPTSSPMQAVAGNVKVRRCSSLQLFLHYFTQLPHRLPASAVVSVVLSYRRLFRAGGTKASVLRPAQWK
jgi:hypothetical protein